MASSLVEQKRRNKLYNIVAGKYGITNFDIYDKQENMIKDAFPHSKEKFSYIDPVLKEKFSYIDPVLKEKFSYIDPILNEKFNYSEPRLKEDIMNIIDKKIKEGFCPFELVGQSQNCNCGRCSSRRRRRNMMDALLIIIGIVIVFSLINLARKN
jgi:hypothetical protein